MLNFLRSRLDWRAVLLVTLLAGAAALPFLATAASRRDFYRFEVTLTAAQDGTTRITWDDGRGFTDEHSSAQPLRATAKPARYGYLLPSGPLRSLRLLPSSGANHLTLTRARILDRSNRVLHDFPVAAFHASPGAFSITRAGDTLRLETLSGGGEFELALPAGFTLPRTGQFYWAAARPVALPIGCAGLFLILAASVERFRRLAARVAAIFRTRPVLAVMTAGAVAVVIQCHPVIFAGRSFAAPTNGGLMLYGGLPTLPGSREAVYADTMGSDVGAFLFQHLYYPMVQRRALRDGELSAWNRYSLTGVPLLGQGQSMLLDPANVITIAADGAAWAWDVRFVLARWLFAVGVGIAVWRLTRHVGAATLVAVAAPFIGFFSYRLLHPENFTLGYAPWVLVAWLGWRDADSPRAMLRALGGIALANWLLLASGTVKEAYLQALVLNLAGGAAAWFGRSRPFARWQLASTAVAALAFALLAAPLWWPFLNSLRWAELAAASPGALTLPPTQALGFFDDAFYRQHSSGHYVVAPALNFVFLLGALAWLVSPATWKTDRAGAALAATAAVLAAIVFGLVPDAWLTALPFLGQVGHLHTTLSSILVVIVASLAGCGLARVWRDGLPRVAWIGGGLALAAAGIASLAWPAKPAFSFAHAASLVVAVAALWGLAIPFLRRPAIACVAFCLGLPLLTWRHAQAVRSDFNAWVFVPGAREDIHAASAATRALDADQREPGRVAGWDYTLFTSHQIALGHEGIFGVDALRSGPFLELCRALGLDPAIDWEKPLPSTALTELRPALDFLNVTHHLVPRTANVPADAQLEPVALADLGLYRSPMAWPRAFFTDRLDRYDDVADLADRIRRADRPFAAIQAGDRAPLALSGEATTRSVVPARDYRLTAQTTAFTVDTDRPGIAVVQEAFWAGATHAEIDGTAAAVFRINHAFIGIALPEPGRHVVIVRHTAPALGRALFASLVGLALATGVGVWSWRSAAARSLHSTSSSPP